MRCRKSSCIDKATEASGLIHPTKAMNSQNIISKATIVQWNVGLSIHTKREKIVDLMRMNIPIICVNEGNIGVDDTFSGYVLYRERNVEKSKASIYIRTDIPQSAIVLNPVENVHCCAATVILNKKEYNVMTVYLSPNKVVDMGELKKCMMLRKWHIVNGDFNAKHESWGSDVSCRRGRELSALVQDEMNMVVVNDGSPTFRRNFRSGFVESHLDVTVVSEELVRQCMWKVDSIEGVFDHARSWVEIEGVCRRGWRTVRVTDWVGYREIVSQRLGSEDLEAVIRMAKELATQKVRTPGWAAAPDKRLAEMLAELQRIKNVFRRTGSLEWFARGEALKTAIREYSDHLKERRTESYVSSLSHTSSLSDIWRTLKQNKENVPASPFMACCIANKLDTSEALLHLLDNTIGRTDERKEEEIWAVPQISSSTTSHVTAEFSMWEMEVAMSAGKDDSALGPDGISNKDLKSLPQEGKQQILQEFNVILRSGEWPRKWKLAEGIPLLKADKCKNTLKSYRVIVKSSHMAKMMERMLLRRLMVVLEHSGTFTDEMTAYRPLRSPQDNLLDICSDIQHALAKDEHIVAVFFDVSGAYNRLRHEIIGNMLKSAGIPPKSSFFKVIMSHLRDRKIRMRCGDTVTEEIMIPNHGVSQGGVLSPALFVACTKRLREKLPAGFNLSQFSDDAVLWIRCKGREPSHFWYNQLQIVLREMVKTLGEMGMSIETEKTVMMEIGTKGRRKKNEIPLSLDGVAIKKVKETKFLGGWLQSDGRWNRQVDVLEGVSVKVENLLKNMCGRTWGISPQNALKLVNALVVSKMRYVLPFMDSLKKEQLKKLDSCIARCVKKALGLLKMTSNEVALAEAAIPPAKLQQVACLESLLVRVINTKSAIIGRIINDRNNSQAHHILKNREWAAHGISTPRVHVVNLSGTERVSFTEGNMPASKGEDHCLIYTDGSWVESRNVGGAGAHCVTHAWQDSRHLQNCHGALEAELYAVFLGLSHACQSRVEAATICTDSKKAINLIRCAQSSQHTAQMTEVITEMMRFIGEVEITWVKAHSGIDHNEKADTIAKSALSAEAPRTTMPNSIKQVRISIRRNMKDRWRRHFEVQCRNSKRLQMGLSVVETFEVAPAPRDIAVAVHRIRCGKGMTASTKVQLKISDDDRCGVCGVREDVVHVVEHCKKYDSQRDEWRRTVELKTGEEGSLVRRMAMPIWMLTLFVKSSGVEV